MRRDARPQGEGRGHVMGGDLVVSTVAIGQRSCHASDAMQTSPGQPTGLEFVAQESRAFSRHGCVTVEFGTTEAAVQHALALHRHFANRQDSRLNRRGAFTIGLTE
jgi:hypothetical protein